MCRNKVSGIIKVGPPGFEPGTNQLCIPPRFSPPPLCGVCGLDYPFAPPKCVRGACRLVSTPSP